MRQSLCNRCGDLYRSAHGGGKLDLSHGRVGIDANLCRDCYEDIVSAYKEGYDDGA